MGTRSDCTINDSLLWLSVPRWFLFIGLVEGLEGTGMTQFGSGSTGDPPFLEGTRCFYRDARMRLSSVCRAPNSLLLSLESFTSFAGIRSSISFHFMFQSWISTDLRSWLSDSLLPDHTRRLEMLSNNTLYSFAHSSIHFCRHIFHLPSTVLFLANGLTT